MENFYELYYHFYCVFFDVSENKGDDQNTGGEFVFISCIRKATGNREMERGAYESLYESDYLFIYTDSGWHVWLPR